MDTIDTIEIYALKGPEQKKPFWVSHFIVPNANELLVKIKTKMVSKVLVLPQVTPILPPYLNHLAMVLLISLWV